jgi:zinc transport system substrate-binding protein
MACWRLLCVLPLVLALLPACSRSEAPTNPGRLQVVTTLFPLYDFVRAVGGDRVQASLLLPPGVEPHGFEPKPEDMVRISKADLFVYTSPVMEPWAKKLLAGIAGGRLQTVVAGERATYLSNAAGHDHDDHDHVSGQDPHIWLDLGNAALMVDAIAAGLVRKDPANREFYLGNAAAYKGQLTALDSRFRQGLSSCRTREFLSGGHFAFSYLARRYNLTYHSAYGISADTEPTAKTMMQLVQQLRAQRLRTIFTEELLSPRLAETIARETGAAILPLHGLHNLSKEDLARGVTFLSLMEANLKNLRIGLECR